MNQDKVLLSVEELQNMGQLLNNMMTSLDLINIAIEGLGVAEKHDTATFQWMTNRFLDTLHTQNQKTAETLDGISLKLMECNNAEILQK